MCVQFYLIYFPFVLSIDYVCLEFYKWKKNIEDKENCQYVRNTSMKPGNKVQYIYFDCHRSYNPRLKSKVNFFLLYFVYKSNTIILLCANYELNK